MSAPERVQVTVAENGVSIDVVSPHFFSAPYILATPAALADSPEVAAIAAEAVEKAAQAVRDQILNYPLRTMLTNKHHADRLANIVRASAKIEARVETLNYCRAEGETIQEMRVNLQRNPLGQALINMGDCKLVWANEGDLYAIDAAALRTGETG